MNSKLGLKTLAHTIQIASFFLGWFECTAHAEPATGKKPSFSPDKKWEYRVIRRRGMREGDLCKGGTNESVLDLTLDYGDRQAENSAVIWAPDSKRFAFNRWDGPQTSRVRFFQLQDGNWVELEAPDDKIDVFFKGALAAKKVHKQLSAPPTGYWDCLEVSEWIDADTVLLRAVGTLDSNWESVALGFAFTIKFDAEGNWKMVASEPLSKEETQRLGSTHSHLLKITQ